MIALCIVPRSFVTRHRYPPFMTRLRAPRPRVVCRAAAGLYLVAVLVAAGALARSASTAAEKPEETGEPI